MDGVGFTLEQQARLRHWRNDEPWKFRSLRGAVERYLKSHPFGSLALVNWDHALSEIEKLPNPDAPDDDDDDEMSEAEMITFGACFVFERGLTEDELSRLAVLDEPLARFHQRLQSIPPDDIIRIRKWAAEHGAYSDDDIGKAIKTLKIKLGETRFGDAAEDCTDLLNDLREAHRHAIN